MSISRKCFKNPRDNKSFEYETLRILQRQKLFKIVGGLPPNNVNKGHLKHNIIKVRIVVCLVLL